MTKDKIEILAVDLLDKNRAIVEKLRLLSQKLELGFGWHYLLDLSWATRLLTPTQGMQVLDAGAGWGIMQWWLAEQGVDVISVDRLKRYNLPARLLHEYRIRGWRKEDLAHPVNARDFLPPLAPSRWNLYPRKLSSAMTKIKMHFSAKENTGKVFIYNQDLTNMPDIPNNSVDAIVSISSLEHNSHEGLRASVKELMRVLKPGGKLIATLGAAKEKDWFHEPSKGWCFTEQTLRDIFSLPDNCASNYDHYEDLFELLQDGGELRDNLDKLYFESDKNGMPWGVWDPKYQSVGVVKVKR